MADATKKAAVPNSAGKEVATTKAPRGRQVKLQKVCIEDGKLTLQGDDAAHAMVMRACGSDSGEFLSYCITNLLNILPQDPEQDDFTLDMNSALAMLGAIAPQDELEAMLAVQMVASNHMALLTTRRLKHGQTIESRQLNGNLATKFQRTFIAQMDALGKHRRKGEQVVKHVHVNEGGQAVIAGTVNTGGAKNG